MTRGLALGLGRAGLKNCKMPQTAQYPSEIPKTKATTIVKSRRNDIKTGVMCFLFYNLRVVARGHRQSYCSPR